MMPLVLSLVALALSIWIVFPGPVVPLFALTVGGTELWPILTAFNAFALTVALRSRGWARPAATGFAASALACSLVPPFAYAISPGHVPLSALLAPLPLVVMPADPPPRAPVVLAIYGGAWEHGSPANDALLNSIVASWGYRVIALDYPHAPGARWPAQRTAILRQIDALPPGPVAVLGHSSGAQLAMIAGAMRPHRIGAIVTYESPVDLQMGYEHPSQPDVINVRRVMSDLCGGTPAQQPGCYRSGSPRYAVHAGMAPVLMIAAGRDHVVNLSYERLLRDELQRDGVDVTFVVLPWADHAFEDVPIGFHDRIALWYLRRFLDAHLKAPAP